MFAHTSRLHTLKHQLDLQPIAAALLGSGRKHGKAVMYRAPWRADDDHASFAVYKDGWRDFGTREHGDIYDFFQRHFGWSLTEAKTHVENYYGGLRVPFSDYVPSPAHHEPPSAAWQSAAQQLMLEGVRYLHSDKPHAKWVYDYLKNQRGLSDETIRRARLGYNPRWQIMNWRDAEGQPARLAPGIIIPVEADGALWALRVRCRVGNLAAALGRKDETYKDGSPYPKYLSAPGSKLVGSLFNADALSLNRPALFVEGEFDALLAAQHLGDQVSVVTLGSTANTLANRWRDRLPETVYLALDADAPGQSATSRLQLDLPHAHPIPIPAGKDITDFVVQHRGDLKEWFVFREHSLLTNIRRGASRSAPTYPKTTPWFAHSVPNSWRSALLTYLPGGIALLFELLNHALLTGCLDPDDFTVPEVKQASIDLGYHIPPSTIDRLLKSMCGVFFSPIESSLKDKINTPTNEKRSGAPALHYAVRPLMLIKTQLLEWAAPRVKEGFNPVGEDGTLVQFTPAILDPIAVAEADPEPINTALSDAWECQPDLKKRSGKRTLARQSSLKKSLEDHDSVDLPAGWPLTCLSEYRAAFAHAVLEIREGEQIARRDITALFGVCSASIGTLIKSASFKAVPHYHEADIISGEDIRAQIHQNRQASQGYPLAVIVTTPAQRLCEYPYQAHLAPDFIEEQLERGCTVQVRYQQANSYHLVSPTPPTKSVAEAKRQQPPCTGEPRPTEAENGAFSRSNSGHAKRRRKKRFYGPGHDPVWVLGQLRLGLRLAGGWIERDDESMLNPATGEIIAGDDANALVAAILALKPPTESTG